jgi:hypothetical protein
VFLCLHSSDGVPHADLYSFWSLSFRSSIRGGLAPVLAQRRLYTLEAYFQLPNLTAFRLPPAAINVVFLFVLLHRGMWKCT